MGNLSGISLELVGKSDVFVWECVWNAHGLLGNEWGICKGLLRIIWETVDIRRGCWGMHWEFVGNSYELLGKPLVFIGNPWRISGDFWLGIHSLGEVQIQTEHIHTHAKNNAFLIKQSSDFDPLFEPKRGAKWEQRETKMIKKGI